MRVMFNRITYGTSVIEVIQFIRFDNNCLGLVMPDAIRLEKKNYDTYESTTKIEEADYNRWCEQLLRTGYLDLTRTGLEFKATHAT
ncbi:MAG: hypothetical protein IKS60_04905 [Lachnospiraceae bacterium]|nr:hypothetical protein [Lachnospiraceae bacterium]MBR5066423.1 hypothetical protein [Lachnospiraceae bacterium]MBR5917609.1 hypothetical protein [Lachnospiraceae bacterium]